MQRAEPLRRPGILKYLLVALNEDTKNRIMDELPYPQYQFLQSPTVDSVVHLLPNADLVISNVYSKDDDDGYNFIAEVQRLRKNIPHVVIFEAEELDDPEITRAIQLGACYILVNPVSEPSDEIKNLRQHIFSGSAQNELFVTRQIEGPSSSSSKKLRMVWRKPLHDLFVNALNQVGDGATAQGILKVMKQNRNLNVFTGGEVLTNTHVSSHLQKYWKKEKERLEQSHQFMSTSCNNLSGGQ